MTLPVPVNEVVAVMVPLFVTATPVTVSKVDEVNTLFMVYAPVKVAVGMDAAVVPLIILVAPVKLCPPVFAVNVVALLVTFPPKLIVDTAVSFHTLPAFRVTSPVNVLVPVPPRTSEPVIEVAPPTLWVKLAPVVKVVPLPMVSVLEIAMFTTVVVDAVPLKERDPIVVVPVASVFIPLPEKFNVL